MDAPKVACHGQSDTELVQAVWTGCDPLAEVDPEVQAIIRKEKHRQKTGLELIASEVRGCGMGVEL